MKKFGIFGGTFNPPHIAHSIVAENVRQQLGLDKIIFIPSGNPPLKNSISSKHRLAMSRLAFGNDINFEVSDIETKENAEKSYTVNTLQKLNEKYTEEDVKLFLIIGADNLIDLPKWKDPQRLFELSDVVVLNRPNFNEKNEHIKFKDKVIFVEGPHLNISSTMIRELSENGRSIKYLVCSEVWEYIKENNLYKKHNN